MSLDVVVGLQRGDEGKGRFVDSVAGEYAIVARGNGGANAGHTVVPEGLEPLALHQVPSGIAYPDKLNVIGGGVYLDPRLLVSEIGYIRKAGLQVSAKNLAVSSTAQLVMPHHVGFDALREGGDKPQGSTKTGIAYVASDKYLRQGVRLESIVTPKVLMELAIEGLVRLNEQLPAGDRRTRSEMEAEARAWVEAAESLGEYMAETVEIINDSLGAGKKVLAEGAQGYWLDINNGMYPAVTSSSTTVAGLLDGLGVSAKHLGKVTGVAKAVKSHVGGGPMVTEIEDKALEDRIRGPLGQTDSEYGATTKRPRRIGYPDLVELRNAVRGDGVDEVAFSKLDHVPRYGEELKVAISYTYEGAEHTTAPASAAALEACRPNYRKCVNWSEDISSIRDYGELPAAARDFVELFESELGVPITRIGVGPGRDQIIHK
ncbi:MAG: adenylosuccinate synthetase [Candidatus Saccharimonadales bacterium]